MVILSTLLVFAAAADPEALIDAKAYPQAFAALGAPSDKIKRKKWLASADDRTMVLYARASEGLKRFAVCRSVFERVAVRRTEVADTLRARALACAVKGDDKVAALRLAEQLIASDEKDRALIVLARFSPAKESLSAYRLTLSGRCTSRWCQARVLALASKASSATARPGIDALLASRFADLSAGEEAYRRLKSAAEQAAKKARKKARKEARKARRKRKVEAKVKAVGEADFLTGPRLQVRAVTLLKAHKNRAAAHSARNALAVQKLPIDRCQLQATLGRALRKERKHTEAVKAYAAYGAADCQDDDAPAVAYGRIYSQAVIDPAKVESVARAALKAHPKHRLSDDFIFFVAEHEQRRGDPKKAVKLFDELVAKYPDGDMAEEAVWRAAWTLYRSGDHAGARARLDAFLRRRAGRVGAPSGYELRAMYWRARMSGPKRRAQALATLRRNHPATWQGLLVELQVSGKKRVIEPFLPARMDPLKPSAHWVENLWFSRGTVLLQLGLRREAAAMLKRVAAKGADVDALGALSDRLIHAGGASRAVGMLRHSPLWRLAPTAANAPLWKLAFPLAFKSEILAAAKAAKVPAALLFGLIREESGFDPLANSWAGARGLTQCMPSTARWVAQRHKIKPYSWAGMLQPQLNLQVGSTYLGGLIKQFKGKLPLAVSSYNAGPGNTKKMRRGREKLPLDTFVEEMSIRQTREYVQRVLTSAWTYSLLYPDLGGIDLESLSIHK
jgi:tetratricopeptide (TPR) repeat protein